MTLPSQQRNLATPLLANQWFFSSSTRINQRTQKATIQATDPNNQWFTTPGNMIAWGLQLQGYVGGPWDNVDPWLGWGWWLYPVPVGTPDVKAALVLPQSWLPFGASVKNDGHTIPLVITVDSSQSIADTGQNVRFAALADTDISLGLQITLG